MLLSAGSCSNKEPTNTKVSRGSLGPTPVPHRCRDLWEIELHKFEHKQISPLTLHKDYCSALVDVGQLLCFCNSATETKFILRGRLCSVDFFQVGKKRKEKKVILIH